MKKDSYISYSLWALIIFIYLYFNINIHMHESYVYAGALDGFFDIRDGHLSVSPWLMNYHAFGIYHPNHPLLHILGLGVKSLTGLNALAAVSAINTVTGLLGGWIFYKILRLFTEDKVLATLTTILLLVTDMYWFGSKSGEAYISGQCFNLLSVYFLFLYLRSKKMTFMVYQACALGISMAFHSLYVFMLIPQFLLLLTFDRDRIFKTGRTVFFIMLALGLSFYIVPLYFHIGAKSLPEMIKLFLFYSDEMGVWTKDFVNPYVFIWRMILYPLLAGLYHFSIGVMDGMNPASQAGRILLILLSFYVFTKSLRSRNPEIRFSLMWFLTYFIFTCFILYLPYDITYWSFLMPAFVFLVFSQINRFRMRKTILSVMIVLIFLSNFINDIYPKYKASGDNYFFTDTIADSIQKDNELLILIHDTYAESSFLNYYGIIYNLKHSPQFSGKKIKIIIDELGLRKKLEEYLENKESIVVLSNVAGFDSPVEDEAKVMRESGFQLDSTRSLEHYYNSRLDKTSEFQHVDEWYDMGPVGKKWLMNLSRYKRIQVTN